MKTDGLIKRLQGKPLTVHECEIMEWVADGKTNWEIAQILKISPYTVKNHIVRINAKLGTHNRAGAVGRYLRPKSTSSVTKMDDRIGNSAAALSAALAELLRGLSPDHRITFYEDLKALLDATPHDVEKRCAELIAEYSRATREFCPKIVKQRSGSS